MSQRPRAARCCQNSGNTCPPVGLVAETRRYSGGVCGRLVGSLPVGPGGPGSWARFSSAGTWIVPWIPAIATARAWIRPDSKLRIGGFYAARRRLVGRLATVPLLHCSPRHSTLQPRRRRVRVHRQNLQTPRILYAANLDGWAAWRAKRTEGRKHGARFERVPSPAPVLSRDEAGRHCHLETAN